MNQEETTNKSHTVNQTDHLFKCDNLTQLNDDSNPDLLAILQRRLIRCIFEKSLRSAGYHLTQAALVNNPELNQTYKAYVSKLKATHDQVFSRYLFYELDSEHESQAQLNDLTRNGFRIYDLGVSFCKHLDIALLHEYSKRKPRVYFVLAKVTNAKIYLFLLL